MPKVGPWMIACFSVSGKWQVVSGKWQEPASRHIRQGATPAVSPARGGRRACGAALGHAPRKQRSDKVRSHQCLNLGSIKGGGPCQPHPGARSNRDRCSLPGLAGLTASRRGGTDKGHRRTVGIGMPLKQPGVAEREGFEPSKRVLTAYTLSRRAPSTARTPLHIRPRERPSVGEPVIIAEGGASLNRCR